MAEKMSKKKKILISIVAAVTIIFIIGMILLFPRRGKPSDEVWSPYDEFSMDNIPYVTKNPDEDFKILVITDIQLWSFCWDNSAAWDIVDQLVAEERPNLILLPGDNVSGLSTDIFTMDVVKHMDKYQIPWAPVNGNHDPEGNSTIEWQAEQYMKSPYCLLSKGPKNLYGCGNYFFTIDEGRDNPIYSFGMLDHGRYYDYGPDPKFADRRVREVYMSYEQINWYKWNLEGIEKTYGKKIPNMVVKHFPPPEFKSAVLKYANKGSDGWYYIDQGVQDEHGSYGVGKGQGLCQYAPSAPHVNTGFVDMLAENGSTTHIVVGHDHENSAWLTDDNGITYVYGLKTGPSPAFWNRAIQYGGTVLTISTKTGETTVNIRNNVISAGKYAE